MVPDVALVDRFRANLETLIDPGTRFGVAVSGGPDSLALLVLAASARPGEFEAATVDHGLRPESAAEVLLANYRGNPKGERAADSLFYLGQSLMKLDQPSQACKAYSELEAVYGATMRADLQKLLPDAKAQAKCRG